MSQCYDGCAYRRGIPGNAHSRCAYDWGNSALNPPKGNPHGIRSGWYMFPLNFDPVWMAEDCPAYNQEADQSMLKEKHDPMVELFSMLR